MGLIQNNCSLSSINNGSIFDWFNVRLQSSKINTWMLNNWLFETVFQSTAKEEIHAIKKKTTKKFYFLVYWFYFFVSYLSVCRKKLDNSTLHANMIPKIIFRYILQLYFELERGDHPVSCFMPRGNRHVNTTDVDFNISFESLY